MAAWSPAATPSRAWPSDSRADSAMMLTSASRATARPGPDRHPVDGRDDRLDRGQHLGHHGLGVPPLLDHGAVVGGHPLHHGQVPAGRERPPGPGDHRHRHRLVGIDHPPDLGELAMEPLVGGIEHLGAVDGDEQHPGRGPVEPEVLEVVVGGELGRGTGVGHPPIMTRAGRDPELGPWSPQIVARRRNYGFPSPGRAKGGQRSKNHLKCGVVHSERLLWLSRESERRTGDGQETPVLGRITHE